MIADTNDVNFFLKKESVYKIFLHTAGFGFGYSWGKHITVNKKNSWEIELLNQLSPKEIRTISPFTGNTKSYVYGKINYFFALHAGYGKDRLLNRKPYWGGVEVRYFYHVGASLGFEKPIYLYIIKYSPGFTNPYTSTERYDPTKHFYDNIYGRASFTKGLSETQLRPGIYGKVGFNFDFGGENERVKSLEVGAYVDYYPHSIPLSGNTLAFFTEGIQIMSYNAPVDGFFGFYVSFDWGKRFNKNQKEPKSN